MTRIRRMRRTDIPFAVHLTNLEGWGIPGRDFKRILNLDPQGSFVATEGNQRVGLATTTHYDRRIAWIGNVVVKKQYRGRNIGQGLVEHAVHYLFFKAQVEHVALYCFKENVRFYRKLGFAQGNGFVRLRRESSVRRPIVDTRVPGGRLKLSSLLAMDKKAFGADRRGLLLSLLRQGYASYLSYKEGPSASYILVKKYDDMNELGPWVSFGLNSLELNSLLEVVVRKYGQKPIEISCPLTESPTLKIMRKHGFHEVNEGRVMFYRRVAILGQPNAVVAYGFLDKG